MVSGECEERFDDALRVNLDGGRHVFEAARAITAATGHRARVVFASSIACYSGESVSPVNSDTTKLTPRTTYGMTKAICELLLNDHSRKGHFDGRTARLLLRPLAAEDRGPLWEVARDWRGLWALAIGYFVLAVISAHLLWRKRAHG